MIFNKLDLNDAFTIELDLNEDERGFFSRFYCKKEFQELGIENNVVQINTSLSKYKGTLRGIHYQLEPKAESKIVRCIKGSIWDLILDVRPNSSTFGKWFGTELNQNNRKMMYVPKGFGHAFISLEDNSEILYLVSEYYSPENERGIRWDDTRFEIDWPIKPIIISDKDRIYPDYNEKFHQKNS